ncbi:cobalt-zinc-cadmium resistance protein [Cupriavidus gilardii]|uniref:cobalt-zinc-cadmium resistance protein n=1 Tax=Cupriavidus gilardii TaxID=82541 RepID=UPI001FC965A9|nr:cobalt-zinc-cadmium resistance protein [Cupriavidus gilardii]
MAAVAAVAARAVSSDEGGSRIVAPGDDGIHADDDVVEAASHPGYCNIWSADLLDPPDVLDEIEESSALFALPTAPLELPSGDVSAPRHGRAPPLPAALFKPPIVLA